MMRGLMGLTGGWTQKGLLEPQVPQGERNKKNTYLHIEQVVRKEHEYGSFQRGEVSTLWIGLLQGRLKIRLAPSSAELFRPSSENLATRSRHFEGTYILGGSVDKREVAGRHGLSGISPVYLFGLYQTKQADSDPNCNELKGQLRLLLQDRTVEVKYYNSPSEKAKYSIVDV